MERNSADVHADCLGFRREALVRRLHPYQVPAALGACTLGIITCLLLPTLGLLEIGAGAFILWVGGRLVSSVALVLTILVAALVVVEYTAARDANALLLTLAALTVLEVMLLCALMLRSTHRGVA